MFTLRARFAGGGVTIPDAGGALQGALGIGRFESTFVRGAEAAGKYSASAAKTCDAGRSRAWLRATGPIRHHAVGRGSAAHQAGARAFQAPDRAHALHSRRAHYWA